jgi:hypothetical protein
MPALVIAEEVHRIDRTGGGRSAIVEAVEGRAKAEYLIDLMLGHRKQTVESAG